MSSLILTCCFLLLLILPCTPKKSHCVHPLRHLHLRPRSELHRRLDPRRPRRLRVRRAHPLRADIHRRQGQSRRLLKQNPPLSSRKQNLVPNPPRHRLHGLHLHPRSELHRRLEPRRPRRLRVHRAHPLRTAIHRRLHLRLQGK